MRKFTIVGLNGGVGRTTISAHLATIMAEQGLFTIAMDFDPQNTLGLHLGMSPSEVMGITHPSFNRTSVAQLLRRSKAKIAFLPFGVHKEHELRQIEYQAIREGSWLTGRVDALVPSECDAVFLDTPSTPSPWLRAGLKVADTVIVVLRPDATSYANLPRTRLLLSDILGPDMDDSVYYVVNRFDGSRSLDRDILAVYKKTLGTKLLPFVIEECVSVAEALAQGTTQTLIDHSPAYQGFVELANHLTELMSGSGPQGARSPSRLAPPRLDSVNATSGPHLSYPPNDNELQNAR